MSWKILLPAKGPENVLAVGLSVGEIQSLRRTWPQVHCFQDRVPADAFGSRDINCERNPVAGRGPHRSHQEPIGLDMVIWASGGEDEPTRLSEVVRMLKPDGILVCLRYKGCTVSAGDLKRNGFHILYDYAALPADAPRIFLPLTSRRVIGKALGFHTPGSKAARVKVLAAKLLNLVGFRRHLERGRLVIAARGRASSGQSDLGHWISERLKVPLESFVIYAGSDSARRKMTVLAVSENEGQDFVVKIADTSMGSEAIKNETACLLSLASSQLADQVPRVVVENEAWNGYTVQVQTALPRTSAPQIPVLTERHFDVLAKLSHINRHMTSIGTTAAWSAVADRAADIDPRRCSGPLLRLLRYTKEKEFLHKMVVCHRTHGDFVPWNIRSDTARLYFFDWEDTDPAGFALTDAFHFLYRQSTEVGPCLDAQDLHRRLREVTDVLNAKALYPDFDHSAVLLAWMLMEHLSCPSHCLEGLTALAVKEMNL